MLANQAAHCARAPSIPSCAAEGLDSRIPMLEEPTQGPVDGGGESGSTASAGQNGRSPYKPRISDEDDNMSAEAAAAVICESMESMEREPQEGNVEYKYQLIAPCESRLQHLITQMKWRLQEGQGEALYEIGVSDDGTCRGLSEDDLAASLETLNKMSKALGATATVIRRIQGKEGFIAEVLVRQACSDGDFIDVRIAVVGNVDSGKSTLVGVLTSGKLDNGRGLARSKVFRHRHEIESGRTSSISQQIMGLDAGGKLVHVANGLRELEWSEIVAASSKVFTFIDLAGHERYIKTTVSGMTGCVPDYTMVVVGSNMGVLRMTKEHLGVALALKYPLIFAVTKVDMCPENILKQTLDELTKILKSTGVNKMPVVVKHEGDAVLAAKSMAGDARVAPIFLLSSVTGQSLDLLRLFLNLIPPRKALDSNPDAPAEFHIDDTFYVAGVGAVVAGTMLRGSLTLRNSVLLGPDGHGHFTPVQLKSMMNKRMPVSRVTPGQTATFALKKLRKNQLRKGMILADAALQPKACMRFVAEVLVLHHPTTIGPNYQPVVHCLTVRQASKIVGMEDREVLRTGDRARVTFEFMYRPEYLVLATRLIFREGRTKGIGKVVGLHYTDGSYAELPKDEAALPAGSSASSSSSSCAAAT
eukprot:CAMPEP_0113683934 /NCGR_PEP_ID=MMETSP0038_2-20120614/13654_1 /TAXON_ID=2898 /ORGANISM="Cryptomonas paramecium" /LENGTH=643 /DNA_ID=CAMNT_0000603489 /DNA_START=40 /DNA_END=1967 /DNA_ORIENTATION=+ /assembly_acc=CAM_ASM_000170